jgi:DNA-binding CsgD family transcriptional regulator
MHYYSISENKNLFYGNSDNEEIWKIFKFNNKIYFQSFNELFIYSNNSIEKVKFPFQISYCYVVDNEIYVASVRAGIYVMKGNVFNKKANWSLIDDNIIHNIEKNEGKYYIFTKNNGIFIDENNVLASWKNPLNEELKNEVILTAKFVSKDILAIGTALNGLYIVNLKENSCKNINRQNSLKNNAILSIAVDKEKDLWLGLDNGIAHVEINSAVTIFSDNSGILGSVYSLAQIKNNYLFATNHGLFECKNRRIKAIQNAQGQVWDIYKLNNSFLIGHNDGTYLYENEKLKKINNISGGWKFLKSDFDNVYFQANYSGIVTYPEIKDLTKWKFIEKLTKPIRNIAQNKPNELWAADNYRSLYRIVYENYKTVQIENVSQANGIVNDYGVKIFKYKNEVLFLINKYWYHYDSIAGKLVKDVLFNKVFSNISEIIPIDDTNFIVLNSGLLYAVSQENNEFFLELIPEKYYDGRIIFESTKAYKNGNSIMLNLDDGFISYQLSRNKKRIPKITIEGFSMGKLITNYVTVKYNQPVDINCISEYFGFNRPDLFYKFNDSKNFIRIKKGNLTLNNLNSGRQELTFYYFDGHKYSKIADYEFTVDNPWYFSIWMILFYMFLISASFFIYYRWNKIRYRQKLKLNEEELKHQKEILEIELKSQNELNIKQYEKHILELEIQTKSSEVAVKSLSIAKQSEMIENIQSILDSDVDLNKLKSEIKKTIKINAINKQEWKAFETNLNQIHNEFIINLSKKYANLTSKDIKLCVLLKMNLTSKEIAPIMNITFRGVELQRYRLRKKLGISQDENLNKFLINI